MTLQSARCNAGLWTVQGEPSAELGLAEGSPARGRGAATAGCSAASETPSASGTLASTQTGDAPGSIGPTSGKIPALQRAPGSSSLDSARSSPPRGSGREGGVSGAGGRELYKKRWRRSSPGFICCLSPGLRVAAGKQPPTTGRCARATQCWDYLQPLLVQYAGAPEQLNGVATPLPGLDRSAAFPYEEDTSE